MKNLVTYAIFCLFTCNLFSQNHWAAITTSDATSESMDVVLDASGNSYITGYISGDTEFDNINLDVNLGYSDAIVAKVDPQGNFVWVKHFSGPQSDKGIKIVLTPTNEIVITGTYYGSIDFDGTVLTSQANSKDIFIAKLTNTGDVIWARSDGGALGDNPYGLALDAQGNIILTGQFEGTSTIGGQTLTSMIDPMTLLPSFDIFLAKFSPSGAPIWSKAAHAEYDDRGMAVVCDNANNIYLSGQFSDTIDFFGTGINNAINNAGFVSKFNPAGNQQWFVKFAAGQVLAYDIALDNQENVVVTGDFLGQMVVWATENSHLISNPYSRKIFVVKLTQSGNYVWGKANGSESEVSSRSVCVDSQDNIYIGGNFRCNFDEYRDSTGTAHFQSVGYKDIFVSKFSGSGNLIWKNQIGGQKEEFCWGIDVLEVDNPVITGSFALNIIYPFDENYDVYSQITNLVNQQYGMNYDFGNDNSCLSVNGDESINMHVSKLVNSNSSYYNYYYHNGGNIHDSIPMNIVPDEDSVDYCPYEYAYLKPNTFTDRYGPLYEGSWSNGTNWNGHVASGNIDGTYIIQVNRQDQCYSFIDTIFIDYHPYPPLPLLTDDHGVNTLTSNYQDLEACYPDTLNFHFNNICANCTASYSFYYEEIIDTLQENVTYSLPHSELIYVGVTSEFGCRSGGGFEYFQQMPFDTIKPYLKLYDTYNFNDSIRICTGRTIAVWALDSISNPQGNFESYYQPATNISWNVTHNGLNVGQNSDSVHTTIYPQETGWYVVNFQTYLGYVPQICFDTIGYHTVDSFYVEILETPNFSILGGGLLCPDQYNFLSVSPFVPDLTWSGPGILWTSSDADSIKLNESGYYSVSGEYNYGEVTCSFSNGIYIQEKQPPLIIKNPVDGIICPGDSVLLTLSQQGQSYEWLGPEGFVISTNDSVYDDEQGYYACIFTDNDGCQLLTAQAEIRQYITPFLELSPSNIICEAEAITLSAIFGGLATVNWHAPINSNAPDVVVNQAGTYLCDVTQCGMTVLDSVTIIDGSFTVSIQADQSNLCYGDTALIQAIPSNLMLYEWSNGMTGLSFIETADSGYYFVKAWNNYGCFAYSDSIHIASYLESVPPPINDVFVCMGDDVTITHNSPFDLGWYTTATDTIPFSQNPSISYTNLTSSFTVYAAYHSQFCPLAYTAVDVTVLEPLSPPPILGDSSVCEGDDVNLSIASIPNGTYQWVYNSNTVATSSSLYLENVQVGDQVLVQVSVDDGCTSASSSVTLDIHAASPIDLSRLTDTLCIGENLAVNAIGSENLSFIWTDGTSTWNGTSISVNYDELSDSLVSVYGINAFGCYSDTLSVDLTLSPDFNIGIQLDNLLCLGNPVTISGSDSLGQLTWTLPDGSSFAGNEIVIASIAVVNNGLYVATVVNSLNCAISDSITLAVHTLPEFDLGEDSILCVDYAFDLYFPNSDYTFMWGNGSTDSLFTPNGIDPVILTALDGYGCVASDTVQILLVDCSGYGANVVTANSDGINDYFTIFNAEHMPENHLRIFNRWGNVLVEVDNYQNTYNCLDLSPGVYFYEFVPNGNHKAKQLGFFHVIKE